MSIQVDYRSVVGALSDTLDLVGINDIYHGKRVGIICVAILQALNASAEEQALVFDAALLHDIGVSSTDLHRKLVEEFDWEGSPAHAEAGAALLATFPPLAALSPIVRKHHTHWSELKTSEKRSDYHANLIFLADRIDVLAATAMLEDALLPKAPEICAHIAQQSGQMFAPELVDTFLNLARSEAFWLALEPGGVRDYMEAWMHQAPHKTSLNLPMLRGMARLFSSVVDAKSHFTVEHSEGVARIAKFLGQAFGLCDEDCDKLEIAGLLHDIGKLRVPDALLEKPGALNESERRQISSHAYETYRILTRIGGLDVITQWASQHHEIPSGEGYPFRLKGNQLSLPARLMRAADIFQALAQNRPYRTALSAQLVLEEMQRLVDSGKLDQEIFALLQANVASIYRLSQPQVLH